MFFIQLRWKLDEGSRVTWKWFISFELTFFALIRVGQDFVDGQVYTADCKDQSAIFETKSLNVNVQDRYDEKSCCSTTYGFLVVNNLHEYFSEKKTYLLLNTNTRVILRPKITTTDESLRRFSPKLWVEELESWTNNWIFFRWNNFQDATATSVTRNGWLISQDTVKAIVSRSLNRWWCRKFAVA